MAVAGASGQLGSPEAMELQVPGGAGPVATFFGEQDLVEISGGGGGRSQLTGGGTGGIGGGWW